MPPSGMSRIGVSPGARPTSLAFGIVWLEAALNIAGVPSRVSVSGTAGYELHGGGNVMIAGGYGKLVEHLAAGLDIRVGEAALSVDHDEGGCVVTTTVGVHECDRVIVSIPLTLLQRRAVTFRPGIPTHEAAADRLAMANLEKAVFRFRERFWPEASRRMTFVSDDHRFPTWIDTTHHAGHPTLIAFYNPLVTPGMSQRSLDERAALALDVLRIMIPEAPDPIAVHMTDWTNDPLTAGSYSYVPVGGSPADMQQLAPAWLGRAVLRRRAHGSHLVRDRARRLRVGSQGGGRSAGRWYRLTLSLGHLRRDGYSRPSRGYRGPARTDATGRSTSVATECVSCGLPQARSFDTPDGVARLCPACATLHGVGCP